MELFDTCCRLPQLTAAIELVSEISRQLNERKNEAVAEITSTFEELERVLHQRKTALITDLENICSTKQKVSMFCTYATQTLKSTNLQTTSCFSWSNVACHVSYETLFLLLLHLQVLQAQLSALLQGKEHIQSSCSFTEQALSHGSATEVGWKMIIELFYAFMLCVW